MTTGYFKLDLGREVPLADIPAQLGHGEHTILRVDTKDGKTTVHFTGDPSHVAKVHANAVAEKLEDITKF